MRISFICVVIFLMTIISSSAQDKSADTVVVPLAKSSRIIFTMEDPQDLSILRNYDFQQLFNDIFDKLEKNDTAIADHPYTVVREEDSIEKEDDDDDMSEGKWTQSRKGGIGRTWHSYNIDLGTNNYLSGDQFPTGGEAYAVRPWGSWYVGINSVQRTKLGQNFFVEWSLGVSWYNFKFQDDNILLQQDETGVHFVHDTRDVDYIKSKLSATFINASLVPVIDFGSHSRKPRIWDGDGGGFRFGIGPYVGYRVASKSKLVFKEGGDREKEKDRDNFYLNNLRYGLRMQIGVKSTDIFINYDLNDLFAEDKGPKLKAISFGIIF